MVDAVGVWCVVVGCLPGVVGDGGVLDVVDEHGSPLLAGVGGGVGGVGGLVGEDFGATVFPADGVGG